jgi:hypothetical protein
MRPTFQSDRDGVSKLKALMRRIAGRTVPDLWQAIADAIRQFTPTQCRNFFQAAGCDN